MLEMGAPKQLRNRRLAGLRSWPVSAFEKIRIYYLVEDGILRIVRVLHGNRDIARILENEIDNN